MDNWYIKVTRQILYSEIMSKPSDWFKIWMVILMKCNYEDNGIYKRWELVTKYENLAVECGVSRNTVKSFIEWARGATLVTPQQLKRGVRIVVNNYDKYQGWATPSTPPTLLPSTPAINKGIQKDRKTENNICEFFNIFWKEYPHKIWKPNAIKKYKDKEHDAIMSWLYNWKEYWEESETEQRFIPHPATWLNQERWKDDPPEREEKTKTYRFTNNP